MLSSWKGYLEVVRTLLEYGANVEAQNNVRNQIMMMIVINDEDTLNDCR